MAKLNWWDHPKYNRIGRVYGQLTVKKQLPRKGHRWYLCLCSCGKVTEASANNLVGGGVVSCGCAIMNSLRKRPYEWLFNTLRTSAKARGWAVGITYRDFVKFCRIKTCHYCSAAIIWRKFSTNNFRGLRSYNLDRKNSEAGYVQGNLVVCCARCNRAKSNQFTYQEWRAMTRVLRVKKKC